MFLSSQATTASADCREMERFALWRMWVIRSLNAPSELRSLPHMRSSPHVT